MNGRAACDDHTDNEVNRRKDTGILKPALSLTQRRRVAAAAVGFSSNSNREWPKGSSISVSAAILARL